MSVEYRKVLYANYHTTQSGRASLTSAEPLFLREKRQFESEILPLLQSVSKSARIFDMGCGSGSLLKGLKEAGYTNVIGMDLSEEQVTMAHNFGVSEVVLGDAMQFYRSSEEQFDIITGMDIIEHFTKDELVELLQLIQSKLKKGGMAIFRTPNMDAPIATAFAIGDFTHENYLNASSAEQVMLSCGFVDVNVKPSFMRVNGFLKEGLRGILYRLLSLRLKLQLFATARSTQKVLFTPNLLIVGVKSN
ncbi:MAG: class I SAM-dependent methyltransferase [Bacteroidetes bacterium]|nr:class I SAM-dependent methyltransferase [Bacteroidota bacterium]MDA1224560.1 class I SAM-dependent methyltransferase [Bacteroidota bacterium]